MGNILIADFTSSTLPITVPERAPLSSKDMQAFVNGVTSDMSEIQTILNDKLIKLVESLPLETGIDAISNGLDGSNMYVNNNATVGLYGGVFYNTTRPATIQETLLTYARIIANIDNGLKEGVKIGSSAEPITLSSNATHIIEWPYVDKTFETMLYKNTSGTITKINLLVELIVSTSELKITNNSGASVSFWGHAWHPVFLFS